MSCTTETPIDVLEILRTAVLKEGGNEVDLRLLELSGVTENLANTIIAYARLLSDVRPVTIDYGNPQSDKDRAKIFTDMVTAGAYDYCNPNITIASFPLKDTGVVEEDIIALDFNHDISSEEAIRQMTKLDLKPARIEHAFAFGSKYPDVQRQHPVVFLGSYCHVHGFCHVPFLNVRGSKRDLDLHDFHYYWSSYYRLAAVRTKK